MSRFSIPAAVRPATFTEGQRFLFGCLFSCAGMAFFLASAALTGLLVWGGWGEDHYGPIIETLGWALILTISISGVAMAFLAVGGPVGRAKAKAGRDGFDFDVAGDGEPAPVTVTQTTTVGKPSDLSSVPLDGDGQPL